MMYLVRTLTVTLLSSLLLTSSVYADDSGLICPEVYPCNSDGSVQAPFDQGACGVKFAKQCVGDKANKTISSCEASRSEAEASTKALQKQVAKLKKQLRAAKRQAKS